MLNAALAAFVLLALAGCAHPAEVDATLHLADLAGCHLTYPDGSPVDCAQDAPRNGETQPPAGWSCVDEVAATPEDWLQVWTDGDAHYGILARTDGQGDVVTRVRLAPEAGDAQEATFHQAAQAFVAFPAPMAQRFDYTVETWNATGRLDTPDASLPLQAHVSRYGADLWFTWSFAAPDGTLYHTDSMGRSTLGGAAHWSPAHQQGSGADFTVRVHAENPLQAHGVYVPPASGPLDVVPPVGEPPRCTHGSGPPQPTVASASLPNSI